LGAQLIFLFQVFLVLFGFFYAFVFEFLLNVIDFDHEKTHDVAFLVEQHGRGFAGNLVYIGVDRVQQRLDRLQTVWLFNRDKFPVILILEFS
jgi:hypothetical protein